MSLKPEEITSILRKEIESYEVKAELEDVGTVLTVGDGISRIFGLKHAMAGEMVEFESGVSGMILNLDEDNVGVVILGSDRDVKEGDIVRRTGRIAEVPVGSGLTGRGKSVV